MRKHFSAVKGGRLAAAAGRAGRFSLLLSDVAPRYLDALASGPTLPDSSTVAECREIIERYHLRERFTPAVRAFFDDPDLPETPALPEAPIETLLSSDDLIDAAQTKALSLGYAVVIDNSCDDWDYADAARYLLERFNQLRREHRKLCLLSGGEVTVRLGREHGAGGRNQQFALACALALAGAASPVVVLSAGSDGIDGTSDAAGAIADTTTVERAQGSGNRCGLRPCPLRCLPALHRAGRHAGHRPHAQQPARPANSAKPLEETGGGSPLLQQGERRLSVAKNRNSIHRALAPASDPPRLKPEENSPTRAARLESRAPPHESGAPTNAFAPTPKKDAHICHKKRARYGRYSIFTSGACRATAPGAAFPLEKPTSLPFPHAAGK